MAPTCLERDRAQKPPIEEWATFCEYVILAETIRNMLAEGVNVLILLADWHAWVNDKFDRDMEKIGIAGEYMSDFLLIRWIAFPPEYDDKTPSQ